VPTAYLKNGDYSGFGDSDIQKGVISYGVNEKFNLSENGRNYKNTYDSYGSKYLEQ